MFQNPAGRHSPRCSVITVLGKKADIADCISFSAQAVAVLPADLGIEIVIVGIVGAEFHGFMGHTAQHREGRVAVFDKGFKSATGKP